MKHSNSFREDDSFYDDFPNKEQEYTVKYQAGPYSGTKKVFAEDEEEAIAKVKAWVRKDMTLPMYSDNYKIIQS